MHAFISHSSKDKEFASHLVEILEAEGLTCWIAPRDIRAGSAYALEILEAIEASQCVAIVFTEAANASPHVLREVERAIGLRRPLLPLKAFDVTPSGQFNYFLATVHCPALPTVTEADAPEVYANTIREFLACGELRSSAQCGLTKSSEDAFEMLWQITTDIELRYRKAGRDNLGDDEWIGINATQIVLNEFIVVNRRHFSFELQRAVQNYSKAIERLALAARACKDSAPAKDFWDTRMISIEEVSKGTELYEANRHFEDSYQKFETLFKLSIK